MDFEFSFGRSAKPKARLIESGRGKPQLLHNGYSYRKHRNLVQGDTVWRCTKIGCQSRFRAAPETNSVQVIRDINTCKFL